MLYSKRRKNLGQRRKRSNRKSNGSKRLHMIGGATHQHHFEVEKIQNFTVSQLPNKHFMKQIKLYTNKMLPVRIKKELYTTDKKTIMTNSPYIDAIGLLYISPNDNKTPHNLLLPIKDSNETTELSIRNNKFDPNRRPQELNDTYITLSFVK